MIIFNICGIIQYLAIKEGWTVKKIFQRLSLFIKVLWWGKIRKKSREELAEKFQNNALVQEMQDKFQLAAATGRISRGEIAMLQRKMMTDPKEAEEYARTLYQRVERLEKGVAKNKKNKNKRKNKNKKK